MGENDSNTLHVDVYCFENGGKNLRFQKYPDPSGRRLSLRDYSRVQAATWSTERQTDLLLRSPKSWPLLWKMAVLFAELSFRERFDMSTRHKYSEYTKKEAKLSSKYFRNVWKKNSSVVSLLLANYFSKAARASGVGLLENNCENQTHRSNDKSLVLHNFVQ